MSSDSCDSAVFTSLEPPPADSYFINSASFACTAVPQMS